MHPLYCAVRDLGGFLAVTEAKLWHKVELKLLGKSYFDLSLCELYVDKLLDWECEFDRSGIDPKFVLRKVPLSNWNYFRN